MYICMDRWLAGATPTSSFVMFMYPSSIVNNYLDKCVPHVSEIFAAYIKLCMGVSVCVRESPSIRFTTNKIEAYPSKLIAYPALFIICRQCSEGIQQLGMHLCQGAVQICHCNSFPSWDSNSLLFVLYWIRLHSWQISLLTTNNYDDDDVDDDNAFEGIV